ncbi:molybdopterin molybdotransferase MoeA [Actinomyces slackii]|uniref:Molybdopterin molybdenumtransferase n=1 Tax=Actinomyces slackii TaxID=52774 RepID=A0A3S4SGZ9_9ACTO|nr:gephyrin-like molybdotransferase Glp [Actinomyces slackii]VEG75800.1 Molybdopterin molybdenumtransferase [Actinomyces slackii]
MPQMLELENYVAQVLEGLAPLPPIEETLERAHGRVLAREAVAALDVPPWTNSAMDGYALRAKDTAGATPATPLTLPVTGDVPAGVGPSPLEPGTAQRIMTGAMLPPGADAVVKVEDTDQSPGPGPLPERVEIRAQAGQGLNVRRAGENLRAGEAVAPAGTLLSAATLSALASTGLSSVMVHPRVRVAVVSTGAELRGPGEALAPGTIPDSNSLLLAGLVAEHGGACTTTARSGDTAPQLADCLDRAAQGADVIITSGGVSAGAFDPLVMLAGEPSASVSLTLAKVAMQPGKPQAHGWVRAKDGRRVPLICLPGNPVSVLVSFATIVAPVLARLGGHDAVGRPDPADHADRTGRSGWAPGSRLRARAAAAWPMPSGRRQHVPVRFVPAPQGAEGTTGPPRQGAAAPLEADLWVAPTHRLDSGSHLVASLPAAQALAVVEAGTAAVSIGDELDLLALSAPARPLTIP